MLPQTVPAPRLIGGRKPRRPVPVTDEVNALVKVAKDRPPQDVAYWLYRYTNQKVDDELETLATFFLSEGFEDILAGTEVKALIVRGQFLEAGRVAMSRLRRRTAKTLRDHQRSADDALLDACVQD